MRFKVRVYFLVVNLQRYCKQMQKRHHIREDGRDIAIHYVFTGQSVSSHVVDMNSGILAALCHCVLPLRRCYLSNPSTV